MVLSPTNTIKYVAAILGEDKCNALIGLHIVTGCDTADKMFKESKKTWVNEFLVSNMAVVTSLRNLTTEDSTEKSIIGIENIFARVYCPQTKLDSVSQARWYLFRKHDADCEPLPPTHGALVQHIKRAKLQAMIWGAAHEAIVPRGEPLLYGWKNGNYKYLFERV